MQGGFFLFIQGGLLVQIGESQFPHNDLGRFQGTQTSEPDALLGVFLWAQGELAGENLAAKGIFAVGLFEPVVQLPGLSWRHFTDCGSPAHGVPCGRKTDPEPLCRR